MPSKMLNMGTKLTTTVDYVSVYSRIQASVLKRAIQPVDIIMITSREGLQNLLTLLEG